VLVLLQPRAEAEPALKSELLAEGVVRVTTAGGEDYVFADRRPVAFEQGDVAFRGMAGAVRLSRDEVKLVISEGPGRVRYKRLTLSADGPAVRAFPQAEAGRERVVAVARTQSDITFGLPTYDWETVEAGVRRRRLPDYVCYEFNSDETIRFQQGSIGFVGRKGLIEQAIPLPTRIVMIDGESASAGGVRCWGCNGPYDVTFTPDGVAGRSAGRGRFLSLTKPPGVDRVTSLVIDGTPYMPGTRGDTLVVPLMPGEHDFEIRNLKQPPVFRNWQAW
jgi:hypothetical protein